MVKAETLDSGNNKEGIELLHAHGIGVAGSFILGFPNDTDETADQILSFCDETKIDVINPNVLTPFLGTNLFEQLKATDQLRTLDYSYYDTNHAVISTKNLTRKQLQAQFDYFRREAFSFRRVMKRMVSGSPRLVKVVSLLELISLRQEQ